MKVVQKIKPQNYLCGKIKSFCTFMPAHTLDENLNRCSSVFGTKPVLHIVSDSAIMHMALSELAVSHSNCGSGHLHASCLQHLVKAEGRAAAARGNRLQCEPEAVLKTR